VTFLVDTNVVSEWVKPEIAPRIIEWWRSVDEDRTFLSVVTLAELRRGIQRLPSGKRKDRLTEWLQDDLRERFHGRILGIDEAVADMWGFVVAERAAIGRPISAMDAFLAAIARVRETILVTRNTKDFSDLSLMLINPWEPGEP
jgi:predicted nucleic acid-binding protein